MFECYHKADTELIASAIVTMQFYDTLEKQREELNAQETRIRARKAASNELMFTLLSALLTAQTKIQREQCASTLADKKEKLIDKVKRNGVKSLSKDELKELQTAFQELNF